MRALKQFFHGMSLRGKFSLAFTASMLVVALVNLYMYSTINHAVNSLDSIYDSNMNLSSLSDTLDGVHGSVHTYLTSKGSDTLEDYYRLVQDYQRFLDGLNDRPSDSPMLMAERNIRTMSETYLSLLEQAVTAKRGRDIEQYKLSYEEADELYHYINDYISSLNSQQFRANSESYTLLFQSLSTIETLSMALLIVALIANFILLLLFSDAITKPLTLLAARADQVSKGQLDVELLPVDGGGEFQVVAQTFNQMVVSLNENIRKIKDQMEEEKRLAEERLLMENHLKEAELRMLQAQINPHFLYNTLNAGAQLAMMEDAEDTCLFIENLADFFRYNAKKLGSISTLEEELHQVENYLYILNVRFSGELHFNRTGLDHIPPITLPSLVLQPLVENSIEHGLREADWEKHITIRIDQCREGYTVSVIDNGTGIDPAVAEALLSGTQPAMTHTSQSSVGISNVLNRLRLYYGRDDVMSISCNAPERGTTIKLFLPWEEYSNV